MMPQTLLHQTLTEEKEADAVLTAIAESGSNYQASREPQEAKDIL
jgi:ferritin-like metal-binding protein YciE